MKYKQIDNGIYVLDIIERDDLSDIGNSFDESKNPTNQDKQIYYESFIHFFDFIIDYCNIEFNSETYSDDHIIPQVFVTEIKTEQAFKQYLRYSLYCAKLYVEFLKEYIKKEYLHRYMTLRLNLLCDIEWLMAYYELYNKNVRKTIHLTCGANPKISSFEMLEVLNELTIIENTSDIMDISLRDIQPYRMFVVRQLLETIGKSIIGYESIVDKNGKPIHKFTQISWEFLNKYSKKEMKNKKKWNITVPLEISSIYAINRWSNSFVHSGNIYASYIQFYAVHVLNKLMKTPQNSIKCFDGRNRTCVLYGDFRIHGYDSLKYDFEQYIYAKSKSSPIIKWMLEENVGAYIISK